MRVPVILTAGFRVFFLAAGLFAVAAMTAWIGWLGLHAAGGMPATLPFAAPPQVWHAHEMIWGYAAAVIAGFFLTAVPNWTGAPPAGPGFVTLAVGLWLAGRVAVWTSAHLSAPLVAAIDLAFLPLVAAWGMVQLARRPKPQNLMLIGLLTLLWAGDLMVHLDWTGGSGDAATGLRVGLLALAAMITVIGGRVTPAFTRNAMTAAGATGRLPVSRRPVEAAAIAAAIALPLLVGFGAPVPLLAALAAVAGTAQAVRLAGWRGGWTRGRPILWSLHLAGAMLAAGYLALALAWLGATPEVAALHLLGIGAVGGMTLAVMSRAALGHSGRPLVAPPALALAYGLVAAAAVARTLGSAAGLRTDFAWMIGSGLLWCLAFTLFVLAIWRPVTEPAAT